MSSIMTKVPVVRKVDNSNMIYLQAHVMKALGVKKHETVILTIRGMSDAVRIDNIGRVSIGAALRDSLKIKPGDTVEAQVETIEKSSPQEEQSTSSVPLPA